MSILIWQEVPRVLVGVGGGVGTRRYNGKSQESRTTRLPQKRLVSPLKDSFATEKTRFPPKRLVFPLSENPILPSRPLGSGIRIILGGDRIQNLEFENPQVPWTIAPPRTRMSPSHANEFS